MRAGSIAACIAACIAGSDSIGKAALLRSNGVTREPFRSGLADNLVAIRGFPPQLRWLERNEIDEAPLTTSAAQVFAAPQPLGGTESNLPTSTCNYRLDESNPLTQARQTSVARRHASQ